MIIFTNYRFRKVNVINKYFKKIKLFN
jgi:hypothetical protein